MAGNQQIGAASPPERAQIDRLFCLSDLAKAGAEKYGKKRFVYARIKQALSSKVFVGIAGLRGTGKTIVLRQLASELPDSIYISMDTVPHSTDLFELIKELSSSYKVRRFFLDEIHGYPNWQSALKITFDFLDVKLAFTSSAAIDIIRSSHDLSRRVSIVPIFPFSFCEYLYFKTSVLHEKIPLERIISESKSLYQGLYVHEQRFAEFCYRAALPCTLESDPPDTLPNIVEKIVSQDLPTFGKISRQDVINIMSILRFVSRSSIDVCSYSSIAKNTGISAYKAREYVQMLCQAFILMEILPSGTNVLREPKIVCALPFRSHLADGAEAERLLGAVREEFFVQHLLAAGYPVNYVKSMRGKKLPDYVIFHKGKKLVFEIGGKKSTAQLKGVKADRRILVQHPGDPHGEGVPLMLFGFLE